MKEYLLLLINRDQHLASTGDLLAYAVHAWSSALESYSKSKVISLDIFMAFDRIWHKGLLAKLPMHGLHHTLITWISSFLSDRSIAIRVDGYLSSSGVSKGGHGPPRNFFGPFISPPLFEKVFLLINRPGAIC